MKNTTTSYFRSFQTTTVKSLFAAALSLTLGGSMVNASVLIKEFNDDPNLAGQWTNVGYIGGATGTATWNAVDKDLDLNAATGATRWSLLSPTGIRRGPNTPATIDIKSLSASTTFATDFAMVGLTISSTPSPQLQDGTAHYTFRLVTSDIPNELWSYQVLDGENPVNILFASSTFSIPTSTVTMSIERNGAEYDFLANGVVQYTSSGSYTAAQNDAMAYSHINFASGTFATLDATVDNYGLFLAPEPSSLALLGVGAAVLLTSRKRKLLS